MLKSQIMSKQFMSIITNRKVEDFIPPFTEKGKIYCMVKYENQDAIYMNFEDGFTKNNNELELALSGN